MTYTMEKLPWRASGKALGDALGGLGDALGSLGEALEGLGDAMDGLRGRLGRPFVEDLALESLVEGWASRQERP